MPIAMRRSQIVVVHALLGAGLLLAARPAVAQFVTSAGLFVSSPTDAHTPRAIAGISGMAKLGPVGARLSIGESGRDAVDDWGDTTHVTYAWTFDADFVVGQPLISEVFVVEPYVFAGLGAGRWDPVHEADARGNFSTGAGLTMGAARGVQVAFETRRRTMWDTYVVDGAGSTTLTEGRLMITFSFGR
ncbi:MAG TPA: hypothetical protein VHM67_03085 [Gemmatimonadaceae bacterium]|nr:hypothetical protein [Gemmatimonadaceae bacterium]